jgi:hypothetical protein
MGESCRMEEVVETIPSVAGWVVYLAASAGEGLRVHLYFDDVDVITQRALRRGRSQSR